MGADYLDPTIHEVASGNVVYNLDLWMMGEQHCRDLLANAAENYDVILVESMMGLHDNQPSFYAGLLDLLSNLSITAFTNDIAAGDRLRSVGVMIPIVRNRPS